MAAMSADESDFRQKQLLKQQSNKSILEGRCKPAFLLDNHFFSLGKFDDNCSRIYLKCSRHESRIGN